MEGLASIISLALIRRWGCNGLSPLAREFRLKSVLVRPNS